MATIKQLLNPILEPKGPDSDLESTARSSCPESDDSSEYGSRKKPKLCKDAAVFARGPLIGQCRYPPHEVVDEVLSAKHEEFKLYPAGRIALYPRHIPYSSEKKLFLEKTGRQSLEVFQYQFQIPGSETTYTMLWDYNIGLVRTTPLFKCTGHSKTTPAKMLNRNAGLREICHSITGGALVAQGYWMPFEAAKAVAATFCWKIRHALTPVFGTDFPDLCLPPDHPKHGDMTIDQSITKKCTEQALIYRDLEKERSTRDSTATPTPGPITPDTPALTISQTMSHRSKQDPEAAYNSSTSIDSIETIASPAASYHSLWTPFNPPRSVPCLSMSPYASASRPECEHKQIPSITSRAATPSYISSAIDEGYDGDGSSADNVSESADATSHAPEELQAAYTLCSMSMVGSRDAANEWNRQRGSSV